MPTALLRQLTAGFASNRMGMARAMREMRTNDPEGFVKAAVEVLRDNTSAPGEDPGVKYLLTTLLAQPGGLELICNPDVFAADQSVALIRNAKALDPQVDVRLAKLLTDQPLITKRQVNVAMRVLDVLNRAADPATILPALRQMLQFPDPRVRSKAALLIGRISRNPQFAKLSDPLQDSRVLANAIESLWGLDSAAAKKAFREAAGDSRNRIAGNGAIGLYLAGDLGGVSEIFRISRHAEALTRTTGAWAMGHSGDPRFLARLSELMQDPDSAVQKVASRADTILRDRIERLKQLSVIPLQIRTAKWHEREHNSELMVSEGGPETRGLKLLQFVVWHGAAPVEEFSVEEMHDSPKVHYNLRWQGEMSESHEVKVELYTEQGAGFAVAQELAY